MASKDNEEYRNKKWARIYDLKYYFGKQADEWIDLLLVAEDKALDSWRGKKPTEYPPYLCLQCKRYWSYALNSKKKKIQIYLLNSVFKGILCQKQTCKNCKEN